jgi:KaiC/GvpD/RAD55 family RecA-like ATPase
MKPQEMMRIHKLVEYARHLSEFNEDYCFSVEELEDNIYGIVAMLGYDLDDFSDEGQSMIMSEMMEMAEENEISEMIRLHA